MLPQLHLPLGALHLVLSTHALVVASGVVLGALVATRHPRIPVPVALLAVAVVAIAGLGGARALYVLQRGGPLLGRAGGMASFGGIAAGVVAVSVLARLTLVRTAALFDAIAPAFLVAFGCGRLGCFLNGCCAGATTGLAIGVVFPDLGPDPRHPLQLYAAAFDLLLAWGACRGSPRPGLVAVRCAIGLGIGRVGLECLRDPVATDPLWGFITVPQVFGAFLAGGALWIGRWLDRKPRLASAS